EIGKKGFSKSDPVHTPHPPRQGGGRQSESPSPARLGANSRDGTLFPGNGTRRAPPPSGVSRPDSASLVMSLLAPPVPPLVLVARRRPSWRVPPPYYVTAPIQQPRLHFLYCPSRACG